jgi:hypothetical protein
MPILAPQVTLEGGLSTSTKRVSLGGRPLTVAWLRTCVTSTFSLPPEEKMLTSIDDGLDSIGPGFIDPFCV